MENSKRKSESSEENGNRKKKRTQNEEDEGVDESEKNSERIPKTKLEKVKEESRETNDFDEEEEEDENVIFEAGMVLKVHMENFMCHSKFTVTLGRMLNFITGANGSGKSAVVAAIQLCLGASARRSGRASSIAGLIKDGHPGPAILRIDLLNEGMDAYEFEKYGRIIQVERRINKTGGGAYALLSHKGEVISREKRELEKLLQHFNIFVDNPCCILTQELSKSFINGAEREKYEFFLKATSLERIKEELTQSNEMLTEANDELANALKRVTKKKEIVEKYQKDMEAMIALDTHEDEIRLCAAKLYWSDVAEAEAVVRELQAKNAKLQDDFHKAEKELSIATSRKDTLGDSASLSNALQDIHQEKEALQREYDTLNHKLKEKTKVENELKLARKGVLESIDENKNRIKGVQQEIDEIHQNALKNAQEVERKLIEADRQCNEELSDRERQKNHLTGESAELRKNIESISNEIRRKQSQKSSAERTLRETERDFTELSRGDSNRLSLYGDASLTQLMKAISQTQFRSRVFGPVGLYVTMKERFKKYGNAVEKVLFRTLHTFVVDNVEDRNQLVSMLRKANLYSKFHVIFQTFRGRYVPTPLPDPSLILVMDTINVKEDIIFNVLVDQARIDEIIVVEDERESDTKTVRIGDRISFPTGIHSAVTTDGRSISYRNGNKASEMNRFPYRQLLAEDTQEVIQNLSQQMQVLRQEMTETDTELTGLRLEERKLNEARKQIESQIYHIGNEMNGIRLKKTGIVSQLSEIQAVNNSDVHLSALEDELRELKEVNETADEQLGDLVGLLRNANEEVKGVQAEKKEIDARKREISARESEYETLMENFINSSRNASREIEKATDKVERIRLTIVESEAVIVRQQDEVAQKYKIAVEETPNHIADWDREPIPILASESRSSLTKKIAKLRAMIDAARQEAGLHQYTRESLHNLLKKAVDDYEELFEHCRIIKKNIKSMKNVIAERGEFYDRSVKSSGKLVAKQFDMYMQKKGFSGTVQFDHKEHLLRITTQTDNLDVNTQCNDMRQMSGGERSYTTLCLLLALGHVIECPFRLMDEYDVFLDEISREITLKTIQQYALDKEQKGRQFIILTPHNVTGVVTTDEVRVKRMPVPHRRSAIGPNQTTID